MSFGVGIFLAGDSFPRDCHVENELRARLAPFFTQWIGQQAVLDRAAAGQFHSGIGQRLSVLDRLLAAGDQEASAAPEVVLLGRSSGARVASLMALRRPVGKLVCLGYPFRAPGYVLEPQRFGHLAGISVPTLLIQGVSDMYGGIELTETYPLSPMIRLAFVAADHALSVSARMWDCIAQLIMAHCAGTAVAASAFDENYYLRSNPDVAAAVARGTFASGGHHYRAHGRREGRSFRLLPLDVPPG